MNYTISNRIIELTVNSLGAEPQSIKMNDVEYLWQGDPKYWGGRAYNLFPFCARLYNETCVVNDKEYHMKNHGLARYYEFEVAEQDDDFLSFRFVYDDSTLEKYPYKFEFFVDYRLRGKRVIINYRVNNLDDKDIYFGLGAHPGFNVPLSSDLNFEDYYIEFAEKENYKKVEFSDDCFVLDEYSDYKLIDDKRLDLKHELFDNDIICLKNSCGAVTIKSDKDNKSVTVYYPNMENIGFWHKPKTDAPFVCIEPWCSLPARKNVIENLEKKEDLIKLGVNKAYTNTWSIELK